MKRRSIKRAQTSVKQRSYMATRAIIKRRSQMAVLALIAAASISVTNPVDANAKQDPAPVPLVEGAQNGANDPNQTTFDPTGTGSTTPGAGGGNAVGMPDPGTVGNADFMDPPGQVGNTTDKGFECAPNPGIGDGNPTHTGCESPIVTPPVEEEPPVVTPPVEEIALIQASAEEVVEEEASEEEVSLVEASAEEVADLVHSQTRL